jgi:hypothetical protein
MYIERFIFVCYALPFLYFFVCLRFLWIKLYGLRWLRLLFGREFPLPDAMLVWDALFACGASHKQLSLVASTNDEGADSNSGHGNQQEQPILQLLEAYQPGSTPDAMPLVVVVELMGVAMIRAVREPIVDDDGSGSQAMMALMKWKAPEPVEMLVARALEMGRRLRAASVRIGEREEIIFNALVGEFRRKKVHFIK